jgi:hypothetical protein
MWRGPVHFSARALVAIKRLMTRAFFADLPMTGRRG